jgi:pimeloyl-ACP methyl ester carboxylesterase
VPVPTLGIWSSGDVALTEQQMTGSAEFVAGPWRYERMEGPGHWVQWEELEQFNRLLLEFLSQSPAPRR